MAEQLGVPFFETSAQENINVAEVFQTIAKDIKDNILVNENSVLMNPGGSTIRPNVSPANK
jgi:GTPase SAR1 family protein